MDFKEVARRLGIENCPDAVGEAFASLPPTRELLCRADEVRALEADYGCLGRYCGAVALAAEEIRGRVNKKHLRQGEANHERETKHET